MRKLLMIGMALAMGWMSSAVSAQDPGEAPAAPETPASQENQPPEKADETKQEEVVSNLPYDSLDLQVGGNFWSVNGNRNKFAQYFTPQHGFMIRRLSLMSGTPDDGLIGLNLWQPGTTDTNQLLHLYSPWPVKSFRLFNSMWQGHPEFTALDVRRERRGLSLALPLSRVFVVQGGMEERIYSPPIGGVFGSHPQTLYPRFRETVGTVGAYATGEGYDFRYTFGNSSFSDRTGMQPNHTQFSNRFEVSKDLGTSVSGTLTFDANRTNIQERANSPERHVGHNLKQESARLDLQGTLGDAAALRVYASQTHNERSFNTTAYGRNIWNAGLRLAVSGVRYVFVKAGVDYRKVDYATPDVSTVISPAIETAWVAARFRPIDVLEISGKVSSTVRRSLPSAGVNGSTPGPTLLFRNVDKSEVGATFTPVDNFGLGYRLQAERQANPARDMAYRTEINDVYGWLQITDQLNLTASYGDHLYASNFLTFYVADARTFTAGLSYSPNAFWGIDASYFEATSRKASDIFERALTVSTRIRFDGITEGILEYSTQTFNDHPDALNNYYADRIAVWWRQRY